MTARASIVVTGTEVLTGRVADRNGPWLAEQLRAAGVDVGQLVVVGDRPDDLHGALGFLAGSADLVITSGGLGPTADDLTAQVVADFQGRPTAVDGELEAHVGAIIARLSADRGWRLDPDATAAATRKQAIVPDGASVLAPVGTAPGLVVPVAAGRGGPPVLVLPGPPAELQGMWPAALADPIVRAAFGPPMQLRQETMRLWGTPESELAAMLRDLDSRADRLRGLEITTCLRAGGELEIVTRFRPNAQDRYEELRRAVDDHFPDTLFSADGETIDRIVADALLARGLTIATAESCTAGLLAGRLTDLAGSSAYVLGGIVSYANSAKEQLLGVPRELLETVGAVSAEVAEAMAHGARRELGSDIGVGITGIAGPDGGTADKPVGLVYVCARGPDAGFSRRVVLPGSRDEVRQRTVAVALHLIRQLLDATRR